MQNGVSAASAPISAAGDHEDAKIVIKLEKRIPKDAETETQEIVLRVPTLGDFIDIGPVTHWIGRGTDPNNPTQPETVENVIDRDAFMRWAMRLSGLSRSSLNLLTPTDSRRLLASIVTLVGVFTERAGN